MDSPLVREQAMHRGLTPSEILHLFVITLADVYTSKSSLIAQLPYIASKASSVELKMLILNLGSVINGQRIRLRLAIALLQKSAQSKEIKGNLSLDKYLEGHLTAEPFEYDAIILTHLIVAETIGIALFELLSLLALNLYPKAVGELIGISLREAQAGKKSLQEFLVKNYL